MPLAIAAVLEKNQQDHQHNTEVDLLLHRVNHAQNRGQKVEENVFLQSQNIAICGAIKNIFSETFPVFHQSDVPTYVKTPKCLTPLRVFPVYLI
ncbi:hypothetical protein [Anabaena sp. CCY 0017]|uniref:hypothetical protein n=1 Tax=Anabaena sp. CCY 0017 TaxID=3103866 RepID=UPI0039C5FD11